MNKIKYLNTTIHVGMKTLFSSLGKKIVIKFQFIVDVAFSTLHAKGLAVQYLINFLLIYPGQLIGIDNK